MSVNAYLNEKKLKEIKGFEMKESGNAFIKETAIDTINSSMGRYYIMLQNLTRPIPEILKNCVEELTFHESFRAQPPRIIGLYKYKDAIAELDINSSNAYSLEIRGKVMGDMYQLYLDIRGGMAFPETRWDQAQVTEKPKEKPVAVEQSSKKIVSIIKETDITKMLFL